MGTVANISANTGITAVAPVASPAQSNLDNGSNSNSGMCFRGDSKAALSVLTLDIFLLFMDLLMNHSHSHHHASGAYGALSISSSVPTQRIVA